MTKKILHLPNYYPPHIGGIEDVCHSIVSGTKDEYQHQVICFNDEKNTKKECYEDVIVIRCGVWKKIFSQSVSFSLFSELKKIIKEFDPDIVHFHTPNPLASVYLLLLLPKKAKLIVHWHSDIIEQDLLHVFYSPIEKKLLKRADKILVTSPTYITGSKPLFPCRSKLEIIPNTVNIDKLRKRESDGDAIRKIKNLYRGKKIIFTFGRHVPYKGLKYLIEAAPLISDDAAIVIAGEGPLSEELKNQTASFFVSFIGRLTEDELRQHLYASDIFAFPSITRNEAFGVALAEAMYCGLPSVTFTIADSGVNWVSINGETGLEAANGNVEALAEAINILLNDNALREKLGNNAFMRVQKYFTFDAIKSKLIKIYELLLLK
jgi:glycosyltransferase involved in cell wall biosynthesis